MPRLAAVGPVPVEEENKLGEDEMSLLKIDDREKDVDLIDDLMTAVEKAGHEFEVCRLEIGDFLWDDQICIEHKNVKDFVQSVFNGKLDEQMTAIKQYPHYFLFIDGKWGSAITNRWKQRFTSKQRDAKLLSIVSRDRVPVFHAIDSLRLITAILDVRRFIQDSGERIEVVQRYKCVANRNNPSMDCYIKLPYCGPKRVQKLMEEYPSFYEFLMTYRDMHPMDRKEEFKWIDKRTRDYLDAL